MHVSNESSGSLLSGATDGRLAYRKCARQSHQCLQCFDQVPTLIDRLIWSNQIDQSIDWVIGEIIWLFNQSIDCFDRPIDRMIEWWDHLIDRSIDSRHPSVSSWQTKDITWANLSPTKDRSEKLNSVMVSYATSKMCNALHALELNDRLKVWTRLIWRWILAIRLWWNFRPVVSQPVACIRASLKPMCRGTPASCEHSSPAAAAASRISLAF